MDVDRVIVADAFDLLRSLPDASIDAVITDPPYGLNVDDWDSPIDINAFLNEVVRVLKVSGFFAFTIQMPMMVDWLSAIKARTDGALKFKDHVSWIKRKQTTTTLAMNRAHEDLFIYRKGKAQYVETEGKYEDVKLPGLLVDLYDIQSIAKYISDLWQKVDGKEVKKTGLSRSHPAFQRMKTLSDRAPRNVGFTNVWSFLPHNQATLGANELIHATMKPVPMFERLVRLLTLPGGLVLDPFSGSGTTALACRNTGRHYLACDLREDFVEAALKRLAEPQQMDMFVTESVAEEAISVVEQLILQFEMEKEA